MNETYVVICRDDNRFAGPVHPVTGAHIGAYVLATRQVFGTAEAAQHFADGVARSREPMVIGGDWSGLRQPADRLALLERDFHNTKEFLLKDAALRAALIEELNQRIAKIEETPR